MPLSPTLLPLLHKIISSIPYRETNDPSSGIHPASFITFDERGFPSSRVLVPRFVAPDLSQIRLSTLRHTRKVSEIREVSANCSLAWEDRRGRGGWVVAKGRGKVIETVEDSSDRVEILINVERIEAMDYPEGVMSDAEGYIPVIMEKDPAGIWKEVEGYELRTSTLSSRRKEL